MSLTPGGMRDGRDNVLKLMNILGNPQDTLRVFHVTGSNGKGSICQMISQVLWKEFGKKVGLFTSPHFIKINERFQINGIQISDERLEILYEKVIGLAKQYSIPLSFFEIQVVVMVLYFQEEKVDYTVVEVGLGWTYDGTNIFTKPLACFITSITLEHTHVLWKSRQTILKNKLGILKKTSHLYSPLRHSLIEKTCKKIWAHSHYIKTPSTVLTNLSWKHQQRNAQMVLEALMYIGFPAKKILEGLHNIYNPGRFEWLAPNILVDTANNKENIKILENMVQKVCGKKKIITLFWTTQTDALYAAELAQTIQADQRILVDDFCDRSLPCSAYADNIDHKEIIHFFQEPEKIKKWLSDNKNTIVIYGSFYLIGEIMRVSRYKPFA